MFKRGDHVRKIKGSQWHGYIVGEYSSSLTPEGYAVESEFEKGSVQIYPSYALEFIPEKESEFSPEEESESAPLKSFIKYILGK